ncbi:hypothetical protein UP09_06200 [Bradyrhizobium sp. LTSP885]|nr:hypothetical protein UP09_06200 [Bradyrhizobium sp. LTSP885]
MANKDVIGILYRPRRIPLSSRRRPGPIRRGPRKGHKRSRHSSASQFGGYGSRPSPGRRAEAFAHTPVPTFMESLYLRPSPHLVFKWRSSHFERAANVLGRAWHEMTSCHCFLKTPPSSATGCAPLTALRPS